MPISHKYLYTPRAEIRKDIMDTIETLKQELKELLYEAAMTNNMLFTHHPSDDRALFDDNSVLGIGCFGLDNMKRLKKLR
jgi:hypothetical protein